MTNISIHTSTKTLTPTIRCRLGGEKKAPYLMIEFEDVLDSVWIFLGHDRSQWTDKRLEAAQALLGFLDTLNDEIIQAQKELNTILNEEAQV